MSGRLCNILVLKDEHIKIAKPHHACLAFYSMCEVLQALIKGEAIFIHGKIYLMYLFFSSFKIFMGHFKGVSTMGNKGEI